MTRSSLAEGVPLGYGTVLFLIGNGYNLFLRDHYRERDIDLSQAIERTCSLWNSFANALSPLVGQTPPPVAREIRDNDLNSEQTAQLLYDMLDFATGMQAFTSDTSLRKSDGSSKEGTNEQKRGGHRSCWHFGFPTEHEMDP